MKLLVVLLLAAVCGSLEALPSDPRCAWGQSHWCSSLRAAKTCGAVDHCATSIWRDQILAQDGTEMCQFCEVIVGDVENYVKDKKTQKEISDFLVSACGIIPKLSIATECKALAVEMIDDLIQLISSGVDPQVVCALMGVCGGLEDHVLHAPISPALSVINDNRISPPITAEPICGDCKKFFNDIKDMITSNATINQVEQMIDQALCSWLGSLESECKSTVHAFLPELMEILSSYYDPDLICSSLGVCGAGRPDMSKFILNFFSHKASLYSSAKQGSPTTCMICEAVVTELQTLDRDKTFQTEVLGVLKTQACARLPGQYIAPIVAAVAGLQCNNAVDLYGPMLFQLLASELDPTSRCTALGFCPGGARSPLLLQGSPLPLSPAAPAPLKKLNLGDGPECAICEMIIKEILNLVTANSSKQQIVAAVEKVCEFLPDTVKVACRSFVEIYGPAVIEMIISELDPDQMCTALKLCTAVGEKPATPKLPLKAHNAETCIICETVIQYLEALVENNATIQDIEAVLEKICGYLPATMRKQCDALVEQYGALIIHYVMTLESPEKVCTVIGLCDAAKAPHLASVPMVLLQPTKHVGRSSGGIDPPRGEEVEVKQKVQLLGENECSWGPAYWCASRENADKCKAVDHCKKNVWNQ